MVTGMFAFGPTIGASVNTTLMSYNGNCDIGINIDTAAVPDPDVLVACLRESFAEITAFAEGDPGNGRLTEPGRLTGTQGRICTCRGGSGARPGRGCGRRTRTA